MKKKLQIESNYSHCIYDWDRFPAKVRRVIKKIRQIKKQHPFDAIVFSGMSGAAFAYPLSYRLSIPLIVVRKKNSSHYGRILEGCVNAERVLIVDDFIDSGATINRIIKALPIITKIVGICLYSDLSGDSYFQPPKHEAIKIFRIS